METSTKVILGGSAAALAYLTWKHLQNKADTKPSAPSSPTGGSDQPDFSWTPRLREVLSTRMTNLSTDDVIATLKLQNPTVKGAAFTVTSAPGTIIANAGKGAVLMSAVLAVADNNRLSIHVPAFLKDPTAAVPDIIPYWITGEYDRAPESGYIVLA